MKGHDWTTHRAVTPRRHHVEDDDACEAERRHHTQLKSHHQMAKTLGEGDPPVYAESEHANGAQVGAPVVDVAASDDKLGDDKLGDDTVKRFHVSARLASLDLYGQAHVNNDDGRRTSASATEDVRDSSSETFGEKFGSDSGDVMVEHPFCFCTASFYNANVKRHCCKMQPKTAKALQNFHCKTDSF